MAAAEVPHDDDVDADMVDEWKVIEHPGYWDWQTGSDDWVVSEETGVDVRFKPIDDYTAEYVDKLPISEGEKKLLRSHISLERFKLMEALDQSKSAKLRSLNSFGRKLARSCERYAVKTSDAEVADFALRELDKQFADAGKVRKTAEAAASPPPPPPTAYSQPSGPFQFSSSEGVYYKYKPFQPFQPFRPFQPFQWCPVCLSVDNVMVKLSCVHLLTECQAVRPARVALGIEPFFVAARWVGRGHSASSSV